MGACTVVQAIWSGIEGRWLKQEKQKSQFVMEGSTDSSFTEETTDHRPMCNADIQRLAEAVVHIIGPHLRTPATGNSGH